MYTLHCTIGVNWDICIFCHSYYTDNSYRLISSEEVGDGQ